MGALTQNEMNRVLDAPAQRRLYLRGGAPMT
jgi:hypothetical protein